jgi:exopolyphosphatase / guanosine-5'-triphosphate,3'-diphosphate pyrophosphatase
MRLCLIDLGSNSVRYDAYELAQSTPQRLHREKRMVRLGDGVFESGTLDEQALLRTEAALTDFATLNRHYHVTRVVAVATAALRSAQDAQAHKRLEKALGAPLQVLSGDEEATLIAEGVLGLESQLPAGPFVLIDIGGGSTELNLVQDRQRIEGGSLDLGANRLQQTFLKSMPPAKGGVAALRAYCQEALSHFRKSRQWPAVKELVGSSGSIRALRRIAKAAGHKDQPFTLHFVQGLNQRLQDFDRVALQHVPGMDERRVDLFLAGSLLLEEALLALEAQKVRVSEASLRDGLLLRQLKTLKTRA